MDMGRPWTRQLGKESSTTENLPISHFKIKGAKKQNNKKIGPLLAFFTQNYATRFFQIFSVVDYLTP